MVDVLGIVKDPNDFCAGIELLDEATSEAFQTLVDSGCSGEVLDKALKVIHDAFDDLPAYRIRDAIVENLMFRFCSVHANGQEAVTDADQTKDTM